MPDKIHVIEIDWVHMTDDQLDSLAFWDHVMIFVWKWDESESGQMVLEKVKWTYSDDKNWQRPRLLLILPAVKTNHKYLTRQNMYH